MPPVLVSIPYSPWSRRAKVALRVMGVPHAVRTFLPVVSEPRLRWALRRPLGAVSLPVLLGVPGGPLTDSFDIVLWGGTQVREPLVSPDEEPDVRRFCALADALAEAGRVRTTHRVLADAAAMQASLPSPLSLMGPIGRWAGRIQARRLLDKYGDGADLDTLERRMVEALDAVRVAVGGGETLLERFTYADIAVAEALAFVQPHADHPLAPEARAAWTEPALAARYLDLLAWRDRVAERVAVAAGRW